jgi:hypothetical protein
VAREPVSQDTQAAVLLKSRRRCCICFGLNRDTSLKQGQIAHLDHNSANSSEDNLAFLCFDHHDQYDSTTRQSKNFTGVEVKEFRSELHTAIKLAFSSKVRFGEVAAVVDVITGHYIRKDDSDSADLKVRRMDDGQYHVEGLALWGTKHLAGPHIGELDFIAEMRGDTIEYVWVNPDGRDYRAVLRFSDGRLRVTEDKVMGFFGKNVSFSGEYERAV